MLLNVEVDKVIGGPPEIPEFSSSTCTPDESRDAFELTALSGCESIVKSVHAGFTLVRLAKMSDPESLFIAASEMLGPFPFKAVPKARPIIESKESGLAESCWAL